VAKEIGSKEGKREDRREREDKRPRDGRDSSSGAEDNLQDKVVKGGRRFSFSALIVVGDSKDKVGFGLGKANEVPDAIRKGSDQAKKNMITVRKNGGTIPFEVVGKYGSAKVLMYPAKKGKGIIAGGAVRIIAELAGIQDIVCKVHGTRNHQNVVRAVINGLKQLESLEEYAKNRGKEAHEVYQVRQTQAQVQAQS
jgi:small subunit ribosomal protein S5